MGSIESEKPHVVLVPYPSQGHVTPMLKLAKLLHTLNFHITFVNTKFRLLKSRGPDALDGFPDFPGLRRSQTDSHHPMTTPRRTFQLSANPPPRIAWLFRSLLERLNNPSSNVPSVTCVITDWVMSFALDAAQELGIPDVLFWTPSACGFLVLP